LYFLNQYHVRINTINDCSGQERAAARTSSKEYGLIRTDEKWATELLEEFPRTRLKRWIFAPDQGGDGFQTGGNLPVVEDLRAGSNAEMGHQPVDMLRLGPRCCVAPLGKVLTTLKVAALFPSARALPLDPILAYPQG
jgi:hypothetical protein